MPRRTLGDAKDSRIAPAIGACADDPRFVQIINEAQEILLNEGHWWNCTGRYRFCVTDGCITLPRQIATLEGLAVCGTPVTLRDQYFEFLEGGWGIRGSFCGEGGTSCNLSSCENQAFYRGNFPTFDDIQNGQLANKKARIACDLSNDVGKTILILGFDSSGNWVKTNQGGTIKDGELVALSQSPGTDSTTLWSSISDIQAPSNLSGQWWLWERNTTTSTSRLISHYDYDDLRPSYARYYVPGITCSGSGDCAQTMIDVVAKLAFIPVKNDTDYLLIGNLPALKQMASAVNKSEHEPDSEKANAILAKGIVIAKGLLNSELDHYMGSGRRSGITVAGSSVGSLDPVAILI